MKECMEERERKLLRYVELAARDSRDGCDEECQRERARLLVELQLTHEQAVQEGKQVIERGM